MKNIRTICFMAAFFCIMVTSAYPLMDYTNGTFFDEHTNLVWLKNANCNGKMTWQQAKDWAAGLKSGSCGLTDNSGTVWRLPTDSELMTINNYLGHFSGVVSDWYWSSVAVPSLGNYAWRVMFISGGGENACMATTPFYAVAVRNPKPYPASPP